jgi:hypothetical protein
MPEKPKPTRVTRTGRVVPNERMTAARGALMERNVARRNFAIHADLEDAAAGRPTKGRWRRVREEIIKKFGCSKSSAERDIRDAEIYMAERFEREIPAERAKTCRQLQRVADDNEQSQPLATVSALALKCRVLGLYAPQKLEVTHGASPELALQLDAIIAVLNDEELAALRVVMAGIEREKAAGRLALPSGDTEPEEIEEIEDAEIVEDAPGAVEPGGN